MINDYLSGYLHALQDLKEEIEGMHLSTNFAGPIIQRINSHIKDTEARLYTWDGRE